MKDFVKPGLIANASALGLHWIYDVEFLETLSKKQSLIFLSQDKKHYDKAHPSFYVYPDNKVGDVSVQGHILKWCYDALKDNPDFTPKQFSFLLFEKFRPGGDYTGYVEKYSNQHVYNVLSKKLRMQIETKDVDDHQLVGFMPYIACKSLDLSNDKAWALANIYTNDDVYLDFYKYFDVLIEKTQEMSLKDAIQATIELAPKDYQKPIRKAIEIEDTNEFIDDYAGRACPLDQALPLIIHILYHTSSLKDMLELNVLMGGASSDRGTLLGVLSSQVYDIPKEWYDLV